MARYFHMATQIKVSFTKLELKHVIRENNERVDLLYKLANTKRKGQRQTVIQATILIASLDKMVPNFSQSRMDDWNMEFPRERRSLLEDTAMTRKLKRNACYYVIKGRDLYKKVFTTPPFKCLTQEKAKYVLNELHRAICWINSGLRSMATWVLRVKYYLPMMRKDCTKYVKNARSLVTYLTYHQKNCIT